MAGEGRKGGCSHLPAVLRLLPSFAILPYQADSGASSYHGYKTSSGCPCWDRRKAPCVPKHSGFGWNPNFYALFCCCLCDKAPVGAGGDAGSSGSASGGSQPK